MLVVHALQHMTAKLEISLGQFDVAGAT